MVTFDLVPSNAAASGVFIEQKNVRLGVGGLIAPRSIVMIGQYNDDKTTVVNNIPRRISVAGQEDTLYGQGSMLALSIKRAREGSNGAIPIFALPVAPHGSGVKAAGSLVVTGTASAAGTIALYIGGTKVTHAVVNGATGAAVTAALATTVNAVLDLPVTSAFSSPNLVITAKNAGVVGNTIALALNLESGDATPAGLSISLVQLTSGANNPSTLQTALDNLGNVFYTDIHCPYVDATSLNILRDFYVTKIAPSVKKPFVGFAPNNEDYATYLATGTERNSEAISFVPTFQSNTLSYLASAFICGYASLWWQSNPGRPIRGKAIPGVRVPSTLVNWTYEQKDALVKAGCSTLAISPDGQFVMEDLVTTRKTNDLGAAVTDLRFTEILSNLQTKIYSMDQVFSASPFINGVVVDDNSTVDLDYAIRPKFCAGTLKKLVDDLWVPRGLTKNRDAVVGSIVAEINSGNGGRIDLSIQDDLAAGLKIIAVSYNWGIGAGV